MALLNYKKKNDEIKGEQRNQRKKWKEEIMSSTFKASVPPTEQCYRQVQNDTVTLSTLPVRFQRARTS